MKEDFIFASHTSVKKTFRELIPVFIIIAREIPRAQKKIPTHGLIVSKITYCLSCFANCPGYLKKRMQ